MYACCMLCHFKTIHTDLYDILLGQISIYTLYQSSSIYLYRSSSFISFFFLFLSFFFFFSLLYLALTFIEEIPDKVDDISFSLIVVLG